MPIDRGVIEDQLQAIGEGARWWDKREMRDLPDVLHADEHIRAISHGTIARVRVLHRSWLIVATQRRLVCIRSNARSGWRQLEVNARQIVRVWLRVGPFRGRVLVDAGGETHRLLVPRAEAYKLEAALATLVSPARLTHSGFEPVRMVRRVVDHVLALPAAALGPDLNGQQPTAPADNAKEKEERLEALEAEVEGLREQVSFLEDLLRERQGQPRLGKGGD